MPFLLILKPFFDWLKNLPWQVYAGIALCVLIFFARLHWIGVGVERCEAKQAKAQQKALAESITQELNAPVVAKEAQDAMKPIIEERIKYVQKYNTVSCDEPYSNELQAKFREAATSADRLR